MRQTPTSFHDAPAHFGGDLEDGCYLLEGADHHLDAVEVEL